MSILKNSLKANWAVLVLTVFFTVSARAENEWVTIPVITADYYGWAYTVMFVDHGDIYAWSNAGVDTLGWSLLIFADDYDAGLKFVNLAGMAKTVYPVAALLGAGDQGIRERAWIALGTHTVTLLTLEILGKPA